MASEGEPVVIADPQTEYEIIIIDPGFYSWLKSFARPEGYYSQSFLENRNAIYVLNWNNRVLLPGQYDREQKDKQRPGPFIPGW